MHTVENETKQVKLAMADRDIKRFDVLGHRHHNGRTAEGLRRITASRAQNRRAGRSHLSSGP